MRSLILSKFDNRDQDDSSTDSKDKSVSLLCKNRINVLRKRNLQSFNHLLIDNRDSKAIPQNQQPKSHPYSNYIPIKFNLNSDWEKYLRRILQECLIIPEQTPCWAYFKDCDPEQDRKMTRNPILEGLAVCLVGEYLNENNFDISTTGLVQLGQLLTFGLYFNQTIRQLASKLLNSPYISPWKSAIVDGLRDLPSHLAFGTCLMTASDVLEEGYASDTWLSVAVLSAVLFGNKLQNSNIFKIGDKMREKGRGQDS